MTEPPMFKPRKGNGMWDNLTDDEKFARIFMIVLVSIVFLIISSIGGCMRYMPEYTVWSQEMAGKAKLAEAEQSKKIAIEAAKARAESAEFDAKAEVSRAQGAAQANAIMVNSLGNAENYLRWRYIMMLESNENKGIQREVIYTPAGGMFPITEAGRAVTQSVLVPQEVPDTPADALIKVTPVDKPKK